MRTGLMSLRRRCSHCVCSSAVYAASYSASDLLRQTVDCFMKDHRIRASKDTWRVPVIDLRYVDSG